MRYKTVFVDGERVTLALTSKTENESQNIKQANTANAFCPTGPGGGKDNSCPPSNKGTGAIKSIEELKQWTKDINDMHKLVPAVQLGSESATELLHTFFEDVDSMSDIDKDLAHDMFTSALKIEYQNYLESKSEDEDDLSDPKKYYQPGETMKLSEEPSSVKFPTSLSELKDVQVLGGSTGARLMVDAEGNKFVVKAGNNEGHLRNEFAVESIYRDMGVPVPQSKLYETPDGPRKVSAFLEDAVTLNSLPKDQYDKAVKKLQEDFALDATLANWDVAGASLDNVMVGKDGTVYRIDVAGSLNYRAQGALKNSLWNDKNTELDTMRTNPKNPSAVKVFGMMTDDQVASSIQKLIDNKGKLENSLLDNADASDVFTVKARLAVAEAKFTQLIGEAPEVKSAKPAVQMSAKEVTAALKASGMKMPANFEDKVAFLNPNGIVGNTVFVPMVGGQSGSWTLANKPVIDNLKKTLPEGIKIEGVMVNKLVKEGGYKISTKAELEAYQATLKNIGSSQVIPMPAKDFVSTKSAMETPSLLMPGFPKQSTGAQYTVSDQTPINMLPYAKAWNKLSSSERNAVGSWSGSGSTEIRKVFTNPNGSHSDSAKKKASLVMSAMEKIPAFQGIVHRGLASDKYSKGEIDKIVTAGIGGTWTDSAPHSTSRAMLGYPIQHASMGGLLLTIKTKTGRPMEGLSSHGHEKEILGMPNTKYRITGIHQSPKITKDSKGSNVYTPALHAELEEI